MSTQPYKVRISSITFLSTLISKGRMQRHEEVKFPPESSKVSSGLAFQSRWTPKTVFNTYPKKRDTWGFP
jgi:hypothetical protein